MRPVPRSCPPPAARLLLLLAACLVAVPAWVTAADRVVVGELFSADG